MGHQIAWWILFLAGVGVGALGGVLLVRGNVFDKAHPTEIIWRGNKFSTTNVGLGAIGIGFLVAVVMYPFYPDGDRIETATSIRSWQTSEAATAPLRAPSITQPGPIQPGGTSPTAVPSPVPSSSPQQTGACSSATGPWSGDLNGVQIIVTDVSSPSSRKLQFVMRVENNSDEMVYIQSSDVMAVDSVGKQYDVTGDDFGVLGLDVSSGQVRAAKIALATPLQGAPTAIDLRFNINQRGYHTLSVCVPVPSQ